jgi:enamine deaminase RidA (YjgF/YER057c/UK114 family)
MHKELNPRTVAAPDGHFSQSTLVHENTKLLFVSGQVPRNLQGDSVGVGSMTAQAEQVFLNVQNVLAAHGADFASVVKATIFVTRMDLVDDLMQVRSRFYGPHKPASTLVGVTALGNPDWWLEVEVIAALPGVR